MTRLQKSSWQGQKDLNPQPTVLETVALPIELYPYWGDSWESNPRISEPQSDVLTTSPKSPFLNLALNLFRPKAEDFSGKYLVSRGVTTQVPSAYECLTAVFGKGTGGTTQPTSPLREKFPENRTGDNTKRNKEKQTTY